MKFRKSIFILLFLITPFFVNAQDNPFKNTATFKDFIISTGEVIGINLFVYDFNIMILDDNQTPAGIDIFLDNLKTPWIWDVSSFQRNQFLHPYFGSMYFISGRANNLNFLESAALTAFGSFMWETSLEGPSSSKNDFITTTTAGAIYGEILHRLGTKTYELNPFLGFLISPVDGINRFVTGKKANNPSGEIYSFNISSGISLCSTQTKSSQITISNPDSLYFPGADFSLNIIYTNPYGHKTKEFFDQFTLKADFHWLYSDFYYIELITDGTLYSIPLYFSDSKLDNCQSTGLSFNYNFHKNSFYNLSTSAAGLFLRQEINSKNWDFKWNLETNYIYLASCDNYFLLQNDNSVVSSNQMQPVYTFKNGPELQINLNFDYKKLWNLYLDFNAMYLMNYKDSSKDTKFESNCFILQSEAGYTYFFNENWGIGIKDNLYYKKDYASKIPDTEQFLNLITLYTEFKIK